MPTRFAHRWLCCSLLMTSLAQAHQESPPLEHSGGFGESGCQACHQGAADPDGQLQILDLPERIEADQRYPLRVRLTHPGHQLSGFQISVRRCDGDPEAGDFSDFDDRVLVTPPWAKQAAYAWHSKLGATPQSELSSEWWFFWFAPEMDHPGYAMHATAVAADGDGSEAGDAIYQASWQSAACAESSGARF